MKKYVIKNADGSAQNVMKAVHLSSKEAGETLMNYIDVHNLGLKVDDDDYLTPFDFVLEEVECKEANELNEVITDFESARKVLDLKPNNGLTVLKMPFSGNAINLADVAQFIDEINPKHLDALIALNKLMTIADAWNKEDGFVPDFSNDNQMKYFPYYVYDKSVAKFISDGVTATVTCDALCSNRVCFKSKERAKQFGEQFIDLFNKVLL